MRSMNRATVAVTTEANAAAMTKATASSTRLPRRMKFLKPVIGCPPRGGGCCRSSGTLDTLTGPGDRQEVGHRGRRDRGHGALLDAEDDQSAGQPVRRGIGRGWGQGQD